MSAAEKMHESLLTREEVEKRVGLSRSTIYARMTAGTFPLGRREPETGNVRWLESEIDAWIAQWISRAQLVGSVGGVPEGMIPTLGTTVPDPVTPDALGVDRVPGEHGGHCAPALPSTGTPPAK